MPDRVCTEQELKLIDQLKQTKMTEDEVVGVLMFADQEGVLGELSKAMEEYKLTDPSDIFEVIKILAEE